MAEVTYEQGLRDWILKVEALGELKRVKGAHWDKEMGSIVDLLYRKKAEEAPALLFDEIPGYPSGYQCLYGMLNSPARLALTLGMPPGGYRDRMDFVKAYREKTKNLKAIPPQYVSSGPIMENILEGDKIDIFKFPIPVHHELDGGRFIGTGDCIVTKDPEEGWINSGTYRMMAVDKNTAISYISPGRHGRLHRDKYLQQGKPAPMVVVLGPDPLLWALSGIGVPHGFSEFDYQGGLRGEPVRVIKGPLTGLPIPADAEIALEGEVSPTEKLMEGRFGEWSGHYASAPVPEPAFKIKAIYHRTLPILNCAASAKPPHEHLFQRCVLKSVLVWEGLEKADIPDVRGVWVHEAGAGLCLVVVSIKQRYFGHSRMAAYVAAHARPGAYVNRFTVVVDEDIDPCNLKEVWWAMSMRCNPEVDIEVAKKGWSSKLDPLNFGDTYYNSRAIIDACKPFEHLADFPIVVETSKEYASELMKKWKDILG